MRLRELAVSALLLATACPQVPVSQPIRPTLHLAVDGGFDGGVDGGFTQPPTCTLPFGGPDCCSSAGARVGGATCTTSGYVCSEGTLCLCNGTSAGFHCIDACGTDAFVSATCGTSGWQCPTGLIKTTDCPAGTCFGEPGDCCIGPHCVDGQWTCDSIRDPCQ